MQTSTVTECGRCKQSLFDQKLLNCLHSVCLTCAQDLSKQESNQVSCPQCQQITQLSPPSPSQLPIDFVKNYKLTKLESQPNSNCAECGEIDSKMTCKQCKLDLCSFCAQIHVKNLKTQTHTIETRSNAQSNSNTQQQTRNCQLHSNDRLRFYCTECSKPVCSECLLTGEHKGHAYVELQQQLELLKRSYEKLIRRASKLPVRFEKHGNGLDLAQNQLETKTEIFESQINGLFDSLRMKLDQRQQQLLNKLSMSSKLKLNEVDQLKNDLFESLQQVQQCIDYCQQLLDHCDFFDMSLCKGIIQNRLKHLKKIQEKQSKIIAPNIELSLPTNQHQQEICLLFSSLGQISDRSTSAKASQSFLNTDFLRRPIFPFIASTGILKTFNQSSQACNQGGATIEAFIDPLLVAESTIDSSRLLIDHSVESITRSMPTVNVNDNNDGTYALTVKVNTAGRYRLRVLINGNELTQSPFDVFATGMKRNYAELNTNNAKSLILRSSEANSSRYPAGVFCDSHANIIFTDNKSHSIHIIDRSGNNASTIVGDGSEEGRLKYPYGVVATQQGEIVIVEAENARLQVFDYYGNFIRRFGSQGSGPNQFSHPLGLAQSRDGHLLVTDAGGNRIQVVQIDGTMLNRIGSFGNGDCQFNRPIGIAINSNDQIVIGDSGNCRIQILLADGSFVKKFGSKSSAAAAASNLIQFSGSSLNVAIDAFDQMIVSDSGGDCVQVFDAVCNPICLMSQFGKIQKKLSLPNGVSVDIFGRLVVGDHANNRMIIL